MQNWWDQNQSHYWYKWLYITYFFEEREINFASLAINEQFVFQAGGQMYNLLLFHSAHIATWYTDPYHIDIYC